ncbi:hypothetical protein DUZ99_11960 [Xylanibacillus composti]|uniref:Uncharacterized protein n=1 Tax=Xylanibacillus composti TaxID=1572762 RepID=A0A8J4H757_9BACL|nr:hypothetical protein [Xylanibacillus composti]MDT9725688.1 hypothetical protein [Xylanibacillus composti]GIQ71171.1 hypothetical protein XYCOK13_39950 [Xylanibacillus composti]
MSYYLKFTIISFIENMAVMLLMMSLFKLNYRGQFPKVILICIMLVQLSFVLRGYGWTVIVPLASAILLLLSMWLLFSLRFFHAAIVTVSTTLAFGLIQGFILVITLIYVEMPEIMSMTMDIVALLSASVMAYIAYLLRKRNWGFSFVAEGGDNHEIDYGESNNKKILLVLAVAITNILILYALTIIYGTLESFLAVVLLMLPTLGALVYLSFVKEVDKYTRGKSTESRN